MPTAYVFQLYEYKPKGSLFLTVYSICENVCNVLNIIYKFLRHLVVSSMIDPIGKSCPLREKIKND